MVTYKGAFWNPTTIFFGIATIFFGVISGFFISLDPLNYKTWLLTPILLFFAIGFFTHRTKIQLDEEKLSIKGFLVTKKTISLKKIISIQEGTLNPIVRATSMYQPRWSGLYGIIIKIENEKPVIIQRTPFMQVWNELTTTIAKHSGRKITKIKSLVNSKETILKKA